MQVMSFLPSSGHGGFLNSLGVETLAQVGSYCASKQSHNTIISASCSSVLKDTVFLLARPFLGE